ncbi:hypothetical protein SRABI64_05407 [Pseudomonas carnis]|nr:hypothetical protein SRABI64_05407 [Pseudomonas carnis]
MAGSAFFRRKIENIACSVKDSWGRLFSYQRGASKGKRSLVVSGISFGEEPSFYGGDGERNAELSSFRSKGAVPQIDHVRKKLMVSLRYATKSTSDNVWALCDLIRDNKCDEIILFASVGNDLDDEEARWDNNLPLVVALAKYIIPHVDSVLVVFDGVFLTAARPPRYGEVRNLLDVAIASDKIYYSGQRAPLTSEMTPDQAVSTLINLGSIQPLTVESRAEYFSLLSNFTEDELVEMYSTQEMR